MTAKELNELMKKNRARMLSLLAKIKKLKKQKDE